MDSSNKALDLQVGFTVLLSGPEAFLERNIELKLTATSDPDNPGKIEKICGNKNAGGNFLRRLL